jgi:hypothetical protein
MPSEDWGVRLPIHRGPDRRTRRGGRRHELARSALGLLPDIGTVKRARLSTERRSIVASRLPSRRGFLCAAAILVASLCLMNGAPTKATSGSVPTTMTLSLGSVEAGDTGRQTAIADGVGSVPSGWTELSLSSHPSDRFDPGIAYDSATGSVVLFGGGVTGGIGTPSNYTSTRCYNDTWAFEDGAWTNLSIAGPPPACDVSMAYDEADGYLLAYISEGGSSAGYVNETWTFSHGAWAELDVPGPTFGATTMTYDPATRSVLLYDSTSTSTGSFVAETWSFSEGWWTRVATATTPTLLSPIDLTYDDAVDAAILLGPPGGGGLSGPQNATWEFYGGNWTQTNSLPLDLQFQAPPGVAYDARNSAVVLLGGPWKAQTTQAGSNGWYDNETWLFSGDAWTNSSIPGPPGRIFPSMVFDATDGYMVLFGGIEVVEQDSVYHEWFKSDTWIYAPPPIGIRLHVSATPSRICSLASEGCGASADDARAVVSVAVVPASGNITWGADSGGGYVNYGPYYWVPSPTLSFVGWQEVVPAPNLDAEVSCTWGLGVPGSCEVLPATTVLPSGGTALTWNWSAPGWNDPLQAGDSWNLSFELEALGGPFGSVPADACTTGACIAAMDDPAFSDSSTFKFGQLGSEMLTSDSLPLAMLTVLPPLPANSPPPNPTPPPPPPSVGFPLPVGAPTLPTPVVGPTPLPIVASAGAASVSLTAIAAGGIAAGLTRVAVARPAQRVAVAARMSNRGRDRNRVLGKG